MLCKKLGEKLDELERKAIDDKSQKKVAILSTMDMIFDAILITGTIGLICAVRDELIDIVVRI